METHLKAEFRRTFALVVLAAVTLLALFLVAAMPEAAPALAAAAPAHEWVIVVGNESMLSIVDTSTDIVYGPFLSGTLGSVGGGTFDVDVTPDGRTALISNFGNSAVYFVDVTSPLNPSVITSVTLEMFAEDIAIAPNGKFALVTDGGFSYEIDVIDLVSRTLAYTVPLHAAAAQAVDIAEDGTVVVVDYFASRLQSLYPDASGQLTVTGVYSLVLTPEGLLSPTVSVDGSRLPQQRVATPQTTIESAQSVQEMSQNLPIYPRPVNVAIAPDGQTVLAGGVSAYGTPTETLYALGVYVIVEPGILSFTHAITDLPRATQSIAFSADGSKAYLNANGGNWDLLDYDRIMVLDIVAPGQVAVNDLAAVDLPRLTTSQLFGVDTIAVSSGKAYVGYPTLSGASNDLRVVDLSTYSVKRLGMPSIPLGVAVIPPHRIYLPIVVKNGS